MTNLHRRGFLGAIFLTFFSGLSGFDSLASGADFPALKPTKVGQIVVWRNKKFTAIKSGKKLVWDKGIPIFSKPNLEASTGPAPTPSATPSPTPSPTPSQSLATKSSSTPAKITEIRVANSSEISQGETKIFINKDAFGRGKPYIVTRTNGGLIAFDNICTHEGCGVELDHKKLICKCHTSTFDNLSGKAISGPANSPLQSYDVKEIDGQIFILDYPW
jgi:nitrite reductase/ring-hydroxylating ferredoxin subunit